MVLPSDSEKFLQRFHSILNIGRDNPWQWMTDKHVLQRTGSKSHEQLPDHPGSLFNVPVQ